MKEFEFLTPANQTVAESITTFEKITPSIFNGFAVIGIIMLCIGIAILIHNKRKKKKSRLPSAYSFGGVLICLAATLSYYLTTYKPSDFSSSGESVINPAIWVIIVCSLLVWLLDKKEKVQ